MANIVPLSDLIYNTSRISKLCHSKGEPVFLTKDGFGDMVVMSMEQYELLKAQAQAYLASEKANRMQANPAPEESAEEDDSDSPASSKLTKLGIEKLPLKDVIDILEDALTKQQSKESKYKKRFP